MPFKNDFEMLKNEKMRGPIASSAEVVEGPNLRAIRISKEQLEGTLGQMTTEHVSHNIGAMGEIRELFAKAKGRPQ